MVQMIKQTENKQSFAFYPIGKVRRENIDIFLKESISDMKRREEKEE